MDHRMFVAKTIGGLWQRASLTSTSDIVTLSELSSLLNSPSTATIPYRNGDVVPREEYLVGPNGDVDVYWIMRHMQARQSVVINSIDRHHAGVAQFARDIHSALPYVACTWTNLYVSFGDVACLAQHVDPTEIYVLQLHGTKRWHVGEDTFEVNPGDMLYMPKGQPHSAMCVSKSSVHLTIAVQPFTMQEYLEMASKHVSLPDTPIRDAAQVRLFLQDFFQQIASVNAESVIEQARRAPYLFNCFKAEQLDFKELMR